MKIFRTYNELRPYINDLKHQGKSIGFVPTMGALHAGHISLINLAKTHADAVISSIFVNPTQFAEGEDLDRYPRPEENDLLLLQNATVDAVYLPTIKEIYPHNDNATLSNDPLCNILEGEYRPTLFYGVKKVVTKLLQQTTPDIAIFGEKDYQQLRVIQQLVYHLNLHTKIIPAPILREQDGLAFSSRNIYLSQTNRTIAPQLYHTLQHISLGIKQGKPPEYLLQQGKDQLLNAGFSSIDYIEIRDTLTLSTQINTSMRILAAAYLGTTRLIDNL